MQSVITVISFHLFSGFMAYQHLAAGQGHDDIVNFLVQEGADVNAEGNPSYGSSKFYNVVFPFN
jgi:hypothetical protein